MSPDASITRDPLVSVPGLVIAALFLAGSVSVFSLLPFDWWLIDLFTHFRLQFSLFFAVAALLCLLLRRRLSAVIALLLLCLNLLDVAPRWFASPVTTPETDNSLRLMSFNVNARGDPVKALRVIKEANPDVLLLLEVNQRWIDNLAPLQQSLPFQVTQLRPDNFGIALFSRFEMEANVQTLGPASVPSIQATADVRGRAVQILGVHPPPPIGATYSAWRDAELEAAARRIQGAQLSILAGDFNTTPYSAGFKDLVVMANLHEASSGFGIQGTWPLSVNVLSIPIDHVLHSRDLVTTNHEVWWETGSDHAAVVVDLLVPDGVERD